ncbi:ABC transporter substrate-binding protein [Spelaeicoccus albus]|uniref:4,5-dihydroxyphthalate decarboxylase n=1 Tax=Spelaeicoccus albus TaxID=1280376 RepID=A0A7Z0D3P9_9MICO|nr:ABC transporter substrate-binding protein [Spelaeicoccus albus]NYI68260.1 4,5-dihydroxyphthalate decarboxylase [Spelaeicoccus albus]
MTEPKLTLATTHYEHADALFDGSVTVAGFDTDLQTEQLASDIFQNMIDGKYDAAEFGLSYFLRMWDTDESPFLALPIFPARNFRHSSVFVRADSGIEKPRDLIGKTIGEFALWGTDPGVWMKGVLADEFGVTPDQSRWVIGGTNFPIPAFDWVPQPVPENVEVRHAGDGETLGAMLLSGEIDALLSVDVPKEIFAGDPRVRRLWVDYEQVERDYYRRTGIFPMMHVVAIRKDYLADHPDAPKAIYDAFLQAKDAKAASYRSQASKQHMRVMTPWFSELFAENRQLMGEDWWPYGVAKNRTAVDTFLRYHYEQGLSKRLLTSEDIFAPSVLET